MNSYNVRTAGYSLIELVVVVGISGVLIVVLIRFMSNSISLFRSTFTQSMTDEAARVQVKRISDEIRNAKPSDTGAFPIVEASTHRMVFYTNIDSDSMTERVRYEMIGTDMVRGVTKPTGTPLTYDTTGEVVTTIMRDIRNGSGPVFTYYGKDYPEDQRPIVPSS